MSDVPADQPTYVSYSIADADGNFYSRGTQQAEILALIEVPAGHTLVTTGDFDGQLFYLAAGVVTAYSEAQTTAKHARPRYAARWDNTSMAWQDLRTLADVKADQWRSIKDARDAAQYGGFAWDGSTFDSDAVSQGRIQGAVQLAGAIGSTFAIDWTLADNTVRTLSAADMLNVGIALGQHVQAQFTKARTLRAQIDAATTAEAVAAIAW
jgi:hypothetical protein